MKRLALALLIFLHASLASATGLITDTDLFTCNGLSCSLKYGLSLNSFGGLLTNPAFSGTSTGSLILNNSWIGSYSSPNNDIITSGPWHDVRGMVSGGDGSIGTPWVGWETSTNALPVNSKILFPTGYYTQTTGIIGKSGWNVEGYGYNNSIITYTGNSIAWKFSDTGTGGNWRNTWDGIRLTTSTGTIGLQIQDLADFVIHRSWIRGNSVAGIQLSSTSGFYALSIVIDDMTEVSENTGDGIQAVGLNGAMNQIIIRNSRIRGNTGYGIYSVQNVLNWVIDGNDLEANNLGPIRLDWVDGLIINGNYFEQANAATAIDLRSGNGLIAGGISITGNEIGGNAFGGNTAIRLGQNGSGFAIYGANISGNSIIGWNIGIDPQNVQGGHIGPNLYSSVTTNVNTPGAFSTGVVIEDINFSISNKLIFGTTSYSSLTTSAGPVRSGIYCADCNVASPCTSGGSGAFAFNKNGLVTGWNCPF